MSDAIDYVYALRGMAGDAADKLRAEIAEAQKLLDRLDSLCDDAEHGAELMASSDRFPNYFPPEPPESSGLTRLKPKPPRPVTMDELGPYADECNVEDNLPYPIELPGEPA